MSNNKEQKQQNEKKDLPRIDHYDYDENGKICGVCIIVDEGELPLEATQKYLEWCRQKRQE